MEECLIPQLTDILQKQYTGHWYPEDSRRGSAYRSLSISNRMDPLLSAASESAGILKDKIDQYLSHARNLVVFVRHIP